MINVYFIEDLGLTLIIITLLGLIYFKTKEIYSLTRYEGIRYFRTAFLFFGFAYFFKLMFSLLHIGITFDNMTNHRLILFPLMIISIGFFSTMAIVYLLLGTIWKKIPYKKVVFGGYLISILVSIISLYLARPWLIILTQLILLIGLSVIILKYKKKINNIVIYMLINLFWILNLLTLIPCRIISFGFKITLSLITIIIFSIVLYKTSKWIK